MLRFHLDQEPRHPARAPFPLHRLPSAHFSLPHSSPLIFVIGRVGLTPDLTPHPCRDGQYSFALPSSCVLVSSDFASPRLLLLRSRLLRR